MKVRGLIDAYDASTGANVARVLDLLEIEAIEAATSVGAEYTHRATIAQALHIVLFADLLDRVPSARAYAASQARAGRRLFLDHGAVRTVAWPTATTVPPGIEQVTRILEPLGWERRGTYPLVELNMTGYAFAHVDDPASIAQWFISELHPDDFSREFQGAVERVLATATDPLDEVVTTSLVQLSESAALGDVDAVALLAAIASAFRRLHDPPDETDYDLLLAESAEMAWIATEGTAFNHATDRVADVEATADEERISGRPVKDRVEVSTSGRVRQTAHRAAMVERRFRRPEGERDAIRMVPGSFFEFIDRAMLPDGSGLDLAFDPSNAQGIFDMTKTGMEPASPTDAATGSHAGARLVTRPAHTFKVRRRGLSAKRQAEFDEWMARWSIDIDGSPLRWPDVFGRRSDGVVLDIGFGHGESTIALAHRQQSLDVVAVEVHDPGVATLLDAIEHEPLPNVRVVHGDLIRLLRRIGPASLDLVRIFFPDPWVKVRQHHRRLVRDDMVAALTDRLAVGGALHLATDIADYAVQMKRVCDDEARLQGGIIERPDDRPITRFEQRGIDAGRTATDLLYRRIR